MPAWVKARHVLDAELQLLEGEETDYRVKRGLTHLLSSGFAEFETVSPLEPEELRERVFALSARHLPGEAVEARVHEEVAGALSRELGKHVDAAQVASGLYADLSENQIMMSFDAPTPEALLHRYNLSQAQGVLYRASELVLTAYRNDPGEYKLLFRYLKLFRLLTTIEGDPEHGFTITVDGPANLFKPSTRYGVDLAKFLPALLHVTRWEMRATLNPKQSYDGVPEEASYTLEPGSGLVSHYKKGKDFDSVLEQSLSKRWDTTDTEWRLEREVDLIPLPGSVMIPDFRLVHPDGRLLCVRDCGLLAARVPAQKVYAGRQVRQKRPHPGGVGAAQLRGRGRRYKQNARQGAVVQGQDRAERGARAHRLSIGTGEEATVNSGRYARLKKCLPGPQA